jgi:hypothetical protein
VTAEIPSETAGSRAAFDDHSGLWNQSRAKGGLVRVGWTGFARALNLGCRQRSFQIVSGPARDSGPHGGGGAKDSAAVRVRPDPRHPDSEARGTGEFQRERTKQLNETLVAQEPKVGRSGLRATPQDEITVGQEGGRAGAASFDPKKERGPGWVWSHRAQYFRPAGHFKAFRSRAWNLAGMRYRWRI